jgi:hypothetical protein
MRLVPFALYQEILGPPACLDPWDPCHPMQSLTPERSVTLSATNFLALPSLWDTMPTPK